MLSSSYVYGDPVGTIASIAVLDIHIQKLKMKKVSENSNGQL